MKPDRNTTSHPSATQFGTVPNRPDPAVQNVAPTSGPDTAPSRPVGETKPTAAFGAIPSEPQSGKGLAIGLGTAAVVMAVLAVWGFWRGNEFESQLAVALEQKQTAEQNCEKGKSDLDRVTADLQKSKESHQAEMDASSKDLASAKAEAQKAAGDLDAAAQKLQELEKRLTEVTEKAIETDKLKEQIDTLKAENSVLAQAKADAEARVQELMAKKPVTAKEKPISVATDSFSPPTASSPKPEPKPEPQEEPEQKLAWVRLGKYENGPNKGKWYFVAPDGFMSPLYPSRELAVYQAELRAGCRQPFPTSGRVVHEVYHEK